MALRHAFAYLVLLGSALCFSEFTPTTLYTITLHAQCHAVADPEPTFERDKEALSVYLQEKTSCKAGEFKCKDGQCITLTKKCNGITECMDESDEDAAICNENTFILPNGKNMTVLVNFERDFGFIEFHLCNANSCGEIDIYGVEKNGKFSSMHAKECNAFGRKCKETVNRIGDGEFESGQLEFGVQRFRGRFSVWRKEDPRNGTMIQVTADSDRLRIIPGIHIRSLPVQLLDENNVAVMPVPVA